MEMIEQFCQGVLIFWNLKFLGAAFAYGTTLIIIGVSLYWIIETLDRRDKRRKRPEERKIE